MDRKIVRTKDEIVDQWIAETLVDVETEIMVKSARVNGWVNPALVMTGIWR